jgi:hypothetical protein
MKAHSSAFATFRKLSQTHLDFVVVVCHSVPALKADIALSSEKLTHKPDHFTADGNPKAWIATRTSEYQDELARSALITVFSYFEAYVRDALNEIVEFHGGREEFLACARRRSGRFIRSLEPALQKYKRKLQDSPETAKVAKYQKYAKLLDKAGFLFPTDLLSNFGAECLTAKLDDKRGMRAWEIPNLLEDCLLMSISDKDRALFEDARLFRNEIAHGKPRTTSLKKALSYASELHTFAAKIDRHVVEHFFVIQAS